MKTHTSVKLPIYPRLACLWNHKKLTPLLVFSFVLFYANVATAQTQTVTGTVKDENGSGLAGVSIVEKGSARGVTTDGQGKFSIGLQKPSTLVFSYTGYDSQEILASPGSPVDISLKREANALTDVVVVGYGTQRRKDVTGAVSTVDIANVKDIPPTNPSKLLAGQVSGVLVKQPTGEPGRGMEINIRGISSLGAGSSPLWVIDGFPFGDDIGRNINPNDIESISVLKDAVSSAIYGARGSNGVILVTTKHAKTNQHYTSFNAFYGIANVPNDRRVKMMNGPEFAQYKKEVYEEKVRYYDNREPTIDDVPEEYRDPSQYPTTNWYDLILHNNAPSQNYNLTYGNGGERFHSLLSIGYNKEDGALKYTGYDRFSVLANLDGKVNDFITIGLKLNGSYARNQKAPSTEGRDNTVGSALIMDPRKSAYNDDGSLNPYIAGNDIVFGWPNPLLLLRDAHRNDETADLLSNVFVEVNFLKHFKFKSSINTRLSYLTDKWFKPSTIAGVNAPPPRDATLEQSTSYVTNYSADQLLTYTNQFGASRLEVLAGYTAQQETFKQTKGTATKFPNDLTPYLDAGSTKSSSSDENGWTTAAFFGRVNYNFDDRYLLTASFRREGSSRFGEGNKYGDFPAVSAGWRIYNEAFFPKNGFLSDLKFRGSYGITGNNNIGNYTQLSFVDPYDPMTQSATNLDNYILGGQFVSGLVVQNPANVNLKWEKSKTLDVGFDLNAFDNKVSFSADYYNKKTNDMLLPVQIPVISGFTNYTTNVGSVRNSGYEFSLGYNNKFGEVGFHASANFSTNKSKVLEIKGGEDRIIYSNFYGPQNISQVGSPIAMLYGFKSLGIFQNQEEIDKSPTQNGAIPGTFKMFDGDGDGIISYDNKDMVQLGNPTPAYTYGINVGADFKGFDLSVLCTGAGDYKIYRAIEESTMNMDGVFNILQEGKDRWRSPSQPGKGKWPTSNNWQWERESSSVYVYDGTHFWIRNITLGYSFPENKVLKGLRVYGTVDNFYVFKSYPGANPEVNNSSAAADGDQRPGSDDEFYPLPRKFILGLNVTF